MSINLHGRSVLSVEVLDPGELRFPVQMGGDLKVANRSGSERPHLFQNRLAFLHGHELPFIRAAFELAAHDQGAHVVGIGPDQSANAAPDEIRQMAALFGRIFDAIVCCGLADDLMTALAQRAGIPLFNALSQQYDPCQLVADFQTMRELTHKHLSDLALAVVGNGRLGGARTLAIGAAKVGMNFRLVSPKELWPDQQFMDASNPKHGKTVAGVPCWKTLQLACLMRTSFTPVAGFATGRIKPAMTTRLHSSRRLASERRRLRRPANRIASSCASCLISSVIMRTSQQTTKSARWTHPEAKRSHPRKNGSRPEPGAENCLDMFEFLLKYAVRNQFVVGTPGGNNASTSLNYRNHGVFFAGWRCLGCRPQVSDDARSPRD
ncbi:hypothetical protein HT585_23995 [Ensifer sp. HO-A22]|uniref:Aspartate/ornithine carbamoyltransferase carbamoyl-P binding domain-containing protein n=1 Tax=Ensifer oleiphilus TaxID=2742698 RepID=A0A7Y6QAB9_9HYPH|nr:hypothetical protein [Ensifer oleiphilus]